MPWLFSCIKSSTRDEDRQGRHGGSHQNSSRESKKRNHAENRIVTYVELLRHLDEPLGLVLQGGKDQEIPVYIEALRPGGVAQKSGTLQAGDRVQAINGIATDRLTQREVVSLLKSAGTIINLEVSYEMPPGYDDKSRDDVLFKVMVVQLFREGSSFGFTIRGGREENRPITIAHIVPNTMVYRAGMVKVGDRVLQINGCSMKDASQLDALTILRGASDSVTMEIEYEAELQDEKLRHATDPLLVKVLKPPMSSFGISLSGLSHPGDPIWITEVKEGCIADRCGALHVGDQLLSINNCILDNCTVWEATNYLISSDIHMELQIMPAHNFTTRPGFANCLTSDSILLCQNSNMSQSRYPSSTSLATSYHGINPLTSHPETMTVEVIADDVGFGMKLRGGATDHHNHPITIAEIIPDGPAMRLGQLKAGDRVLAINDVPMEGVTLHAALKIAHEMTEAVNMEIEIDVEDPIMPASGSFDMKLVKMGMSLGITVNGAQTPGAPVWISDMKKGGAAYRTGRLRAGDIITAINGQSCEYVTLSDAVSMLRNTDDVVHLRISKDSNNFRAPQAENSDTVTYSVQLDKDNQQLGIVLGMSGNSVVIKSLTDGVARRTGTVKVGNHILAINGENLSGKTLLQIEDMLNNCGNSVTLKIRKNVKSKARSKQPSPVGKESWKDSPNLRPKVLGTLPSRPMLESASSQLSSERRDSVTSDNIHELTTMQRSTNFPTTLPSTSNYTSGETDTNRGSFTETEDEMTSLDDEGLEQTSGKSQNLVGSLDTAHYYTAPHRSGSRISQIPFARAQLKRESQSLSRRKQPEDLEETSFSEEAFQQIKCALDKSGKYLPRFSKIAEHSSSDPDSDYEPSHRGRHRLPPRYVSAKFTQHTQHKVKLVRTDRSSDFGFSISDSALEPGIYIHKVKPGGGAEQNGLKSYDRILKINQHTVRDLDCSRALPLLAKSGNEVSLVVSRSAQPTNRYTPALQNEEI